MIKLIRDKLSTAERADLESVITLCKAELSLRDSKHRISRPIAVKRSVQLHHESYVDSEPPILDHTVDAGRMFTLTPAQKQLLEATFGAVATKVIVVKQVSFDDTNFPCYIACESMSIKRYEQNGCSLHSFIIPNFRDFLYKCKSLENYEDVYTEKGKRVALRKPAKITEKVVIDRSLLEAIGL